MLSGDSALKDGKDMDGLGIRRTDLPDTSVALYRREDDKDMNRRTVVVYGFCWGVPWLRKQSFALLASSVRKRRCPGL